MIEWRMLWSGLDAAASPIASLLIAASLIRALGTDDYGVLVIALAVSAVSTAVSPAISATTTKLIAERRGGVSNSMAAIAPTVTTSLTVMVVFDLLLLSTAALFASPLSRFVFADAAHNTPEIEEVLLIAVLAVCVQQIDIVLGAALKGLEYFKQQAFYECGSKAVLVVGVTTVGWLTGDLKSVLVTYCLLHAASVVGRGFMLHKVAPRGRIFGRLSADGFRRIASFGGWMWLSAIASAAYVSLDRIVVGRVLGAAVAGQFSIYIQITQLAHYVPASVFAFLLPAFSRLSASGTEQRTALGDQYRAYSIAIAATAFAIVSAIAISGDQLFEVFSGYRIPEDHSVAFLLLALGYFVLALAICPYYLLLGSGRSRLVATVTSSGMLLALILMIPLTQEYGLTGAACARFAYILGALSLVRYAMELTRDR